MLSGTSSSFEQAGRRVYNTKITSFNVGKKEGKKGLTFKMSLNGYCFRCLMNGAKN